MVHVGVPSDCMSAAPSDGDSFHDRRGFSAAGAETFYDLFGAGFVGEVADRYGCAFLNEAFGDSQADALIASSDCCNFAFQAFRHDSLLEFPSCVPWVHSKKEAHKSNSWMLRVDF